MWRAAKSGTAPQVVPDFSVHKSRWFLITANGSAGVVSQLCKRVLNEQGDSILVGMAIGFVLDFMKEMMENDYRLHFKKGDIEFDFEKKLCPKLILC